MSTFSWIQYPTLQEPVLDAAQRPEQVTESRWHQPWSEPVRFKISGQLAIALAASGLFFVPQQLGENIFVDKWFSHWREPVRFKGVFPGLPTGDQVAFTTSPLPFVSFGWFGALNEPIVKQKAGLLAGSQRFQTGSPFPFVSFSWFRPQTELAPFPKQGLAARFQQFLAAPPRLLPTPTITGRLNAIESGDTMLFAGTFFARPVNATIGVIELARVPYVGIVEAVLNQGTRGVIESHVAPASGSPVTPITSAAVSIRVI